MHCGKLTRPRIEFDEALMLEIVDLTLFTPTYLLYSASVIAACALWMATEDAELVHGLSGYSTDRLQHCYTWLNGLFNETPTVLDLPSPHASEDADRSVLCGQYCHIRLCFGPVKELIV